MPSPSTSTTATTTTTTTTTAVAAAAPNPQARELNFSKKTRTNHRWRTAIRSFRTLKNLSPQQMDSFMNSYVIYSLDWADEAKMIETLGPDYQKKVGECLADYYSVLNHLCALGEVEKMYIPPAIDLNANLITNQFLYEESIAQELLLPANARVLDLGCGRGLVAAHMTRMTGARVTGINIDDDQLASAKNTNHKLKLANDFLCADFNDLPLPLPDEEFDGAYQIQAFSLAKDLTQLCKEVFRVLKPGAKFSLLDWASLEAYDSSDPKHQDLMQRIKPLIGAVGTPTPKSMEMALQAAGFRIIESRNASIDGLQAPLIEQADKYFSAARKAILTLVRIGLLPINFRTLFNRLTQDCDSFVEADRARLITTSYHWLAEKPLDKSVVKSQDGGDVPTPASSDTAFDQSHTPSPPVVDVNLSQTAEKL